MKHQLVAEKTPGTEDITTTDMVRRQRTDADRDGTIWCDRSDHPMYEPE